MAGPNSARSAATDGETVGRASAAGAADARPGGAPARSTARRSPGRRRRPRSCLCRLGHRVAEGLGELVHLLRREEETRRADQVLLAEAVVGDGLALDLLLQQENPVHQALGAR